MNEVLVQGRAVKKGNLLYHTKNYRHCPRFWVEFIYSEGDEARVRVVEGGGKGAVPMVKLADLQWSAFTPEQELNELYAELADGPGLARRAMAHIKTVTAERDALLAKLAQRDADTTKFIGIVEGCYQLASSYSGCLDGVDEHGGDDHEDPICAIYHRLYYALFPMRDFKSTPPANPGEGDSGNWMMNPCKKGHRDVGAAGGVASCYQCDEKLTAATTQDAFEQWNASHPPATVEPVCDGHVAEAAAAQPPVAMDSLRAFANDMISAGFEGGGFDGGGIQEIAVKHGLLRIESRDEACGEVCACREYGFPAECYQKTAVLGTPGRGDVKSDITDLPISISTVHEGIGHA